MRQLIPFFLVWTACASPSPTVNDVSLSALVVTGITANSATVSWTTNVTTPRTVEVATDASFSDSERLQTDMNVIFLTGLAAGTEYFVRVTAGTWARVAAFTTLRGDTNALLATLTVDGVTPPTFLPDVFANTIAVDSNLDAVVVAASAQAATATVTGGGMQVLSGEDTVVEITVTAEAGNTQTYTLTVHRYPQTLGAGFSVTGVVAVEDSGDATDARAYVSQDTTTVSVSSLCSSNCPTFSATYQTSPYTLGDAVAPNDGAIFAISATDNVTGVVSTRQYTIVRNILLTFLARDDSDNSTLSLSPAYTPGTKTYAVGPTTSAGLVPILTRVASGSVLPATNTFIGLLPGVNNLTFNARSSAGTTVDTYVFQATHHRLMPINYDVTNDRFFFGHSRPQPLSVLPSVWATSGTAPGNPITFFKQRPNTRYVYAIHSGTGNDGVSVARVDVTAPTSNSSSAATIAFRDRGSAVFVLDVGPTFTPTDIVFHPTLPIFYAWAEDGLVYKFPLTGTFIDGPDSGQPGLPLAPTVQNVADPFGASGTRKLLISSDGSFLLAVNLASVGQVRTMPLSTAGDATAFAPAFTLAAAPIDVGLSIDDVTLFLTTSAGITRYPVAAGFVSSASGSDVFAGASSLIMHPTLRTLYLRVGTAWQAHAYGSSSGVAVSAGSGGTLGVTAASIDWTGAYFYGRTGQDYSLNVLNATNGNIGGGGGEIGALPAGTTNSVLLLFTQ